MSRGCSMKLMQSPRRYQASFAALMLVLTLVAAACGGGGSKATPTPAVSGPRATDQQYLKAICTGTQAFSDALVSKTTAAGIAQVIKDFSASMKKINPPADLQTFHAAFIKYLDGSLSDPTSLVTKSPPEPPASVRQRLASEESSVPECKRPTFFDATAAATPTSAATPGK